MYILMPGESQVVEANPDPIGLKVGIVYDTIRDTQDLLYHRFSCKNDCLLTLTSIEGDDVDYYGGKNMTRDVHLSSTIIAHRAAL
jgi:hypothetical protein